MEVEKIISIQGVSEGLTFEAIGRAMAAGYNITLYISPAVSEAGAELKIEPELCSAPAAKGGLCREKGAVSSQKRGRLAVVVAAKRGGYIGNDRLDQRIREAWKPGMTARNLARASGVPYSTVNRICEKVLSPKQVAGIKATAQEVSRANGGKRGEAWEKGKRNSVPLRAYSQKQAM
jgi:hypothetical protein